MQVTESAQCFFSEYECSKLGVMTLTNKFTESLESEIKKAGPRIQAIFDEKVCKSETEERLLVEWIILLYYPVFEAKIGFKKETVDFWPALEEARTIMKKLEFMFPGLTQYIDAKGIVQKRDVIQKLSKKFENDKRNRKIELKMKPSKYLCCT